MALRKKIAKRKFEDPRMHELLISLTKSKSDFWKKVGERLATPRRSRVMVNVSQLNRNAEKGDKIVVPGKLLGAGKLTKAVTVAAYQFSDSAVDKIKEAGGKAMLIEEMLEAEKDGKKLKMVVQ